MYTETFSPVFLVQSNWLHVRSNLVPGPTYDRLKENKLFAGLDSVRKKSKTLTMQGAIPPPGALRFTTPSRNLRDTFCIKDGGNGY